MAQISSGTAKARGVGSYSNVSTGGTGDQRAERADGGHQQRRSEAESERLGHQQEAPDAERAGDDLLARRALRGIRRR